MVVGISGETHETAHAGDLNNNPTLLLPTIPGIVLAHDPHRVQRQVGDSPKVCLDDGAGLGLVLGVDEGGLGVAGQAVACVVDENVDAAKVWVG